MRGSRKHEKQKQHKNMCNKKIRKEPDYNSLQKRKDALTRQAENRKKALQKHSGEERYEEIRQSINAPEVPVLEQTAAHEAFRTTYFAQFKKVVDSSDVLIEVLDARDPMGCRSKKLEDYIMRRGKWIILLLNKADLVPLDILNKWLTFLRREYPTLPFKSSSKANKANKLAALTQEGKYRSTDYYGVDELIKLLNQKAAGNAIVAGVIGPPNAGKSSVINSLSRKDAVGVGSTPGFTKTMQAVQVTSRIRILDCPGVVPTFSSGADITPSMVLRNSIKIELLEDPVTPVEYILDKVPKDQLVQEYGIETYGNGEDFLMQLAVKRGKLHKGGEPDLKGTARVILDDWNHGRIKYFTVPPNVDDGQIAKVEIVDQDGTSFDMGKTINYTEEEFRSFQIEHVFQVIPKKEAEEIKEEAGEDEEDEEKDEDIKKTGLLQEEKEQLDILAAQFNTISFDDL